VSLSIDKYEILGKLGEGSFGEVLLVRHKHLNRAEAAKIIKTHRINEALNEAKTIQQLQHEHIIQIYDADILPDKSGIFITMEYHQQGSIANLKFISRIHLVDIAVHVLRALEHAHGKEFIHRDIKPTNILLNKHHTAILTDFGLSSKIDELENAPRYRYRYHVAPEVLANREKENYKTDLYALGVTMNRIVNGDPDWLKTIDKDELDEKILRGKYPDRMNYRPDVPINLVKIINKALEINPLKRYQSAKEILKEIKRKAIFRYDWQKNGNCWYATIKNINYKIEIQRSNGLFDIITSKKRIDSSDFRRILTYCFNRIDKSEVEEILRKIILGIDSSFKT
jgi:serine/threonine protein kinase